MPGALRFNPGVGIRPFIHSVRDVAGVMSVMGMFRQLTVWLCTVARGDQRASDVTHVTDRASLLRVVFSGRRARLPEEQFPPVETHTP